MKYKRCCLLNFVPKTSCLYNEQFRTDCTIRIWDVRKAAACIMSLDQYNTEDSDPLSPTNQAHNRPINGLAFSTDGFHIISLGMDEKIRLWDAYTGRNTLVNYGPHLRNRSRTTIKPLIVDESVWPPLVFVPSDDHQLLAFDMLDGRLVKRLRGSYGRVTSVDKRPGKEASINSIRYHCRSV